MQYGVLFTKLNDHKIVATFPSLEIVCTGVFDKKLYNSRCRFRAKLSFFIKGDNLNYK